MGVPYSVVYALNHGVNPLFLKNCTKKGHFVKCPVICLKRCYVPPPFLVNNSVTEGRSVKPDLKIGICGEHGGDPATIDFCYRAGLSYVSCSPFRVPLARLAAAQAVLRNLPGKKPAEKKPAAKKAAGKKPAAKKAADKTVVAKKQVGRTAAPKKTWDKKNAAKKLADKKSAVKAAAKKPPKKLVVKKPASKKAAAKKPVAKKKVK